MSQAPKTFEEARREFTKRREERGEEPLFSEDTDIDEVVEDLEERYDDVITFLKSSPETLSKLGFRSISTPEQRIGTTVGPLRLRLSELEGILDDLASDLQDAESQIDILRNIAQSNLFIAQRMSVISSTQVEMLDAVFNILGSLEPFSRITVSGTNEIQNVDTAEPVVPDSDNIEIPTRLLMVKSSDTNTDEIAFGDDETEPSSGFVLAPGESISINVDLRDEALFMASESTGQVVELLGMA